MNLKNLDGSDEEFPDRVRYMEWYRELFHEKTRHVRAGDYITATIFERNLDYLQTKICRGPGPIWKRFFEELLAESTRLSYREFISLGASTNPKSTSI